MRFKRIFVVLSAFGLVLWSVLTQAQSPPVDSSAQHSRIRFMVGGGTGVTTLLGLPKGIFRPVGVTVQGGLVVLYRLTNRTVFVSGLEGRLATYPADATWQPRDRDLYPSPAPDSVKYASLRIGSLALPVGIRQYIVQRDRGTLFYVQANLTVQYHLDISQQYRSRGELLTRSWAGSVNRVSVSPGVVVGMSNLLGGRLTRLNGLLNAATFGLSVDLLPLRSPETHQHIVPVLFTTKFMF